MAVCRIQWEHKHPVMPPLCPALLQSSPLFFFKQKTAYEIGLGIPAEPLFRSHPRRFKIVVIDIQITLKQMLRDFIGIRVNRAKKSGMVNITSSVNSRERSGINTILHELNPLFTINVTMRDIKSKN